MSKNTTRWMRLCILLAGFGFAGAAMAADISVTFEAAATGAVPAGWKIAATNGGDTPARWIVEQGAGPNGSGRIFSLVEPERTGLLARLTSSNVFNLAWLPESKVRDLDASVAIRANAGSIDQGGGLIWRAQNADNYYIARYNPLERNLRIYFVKNGSRTQLASAENLRPGTGEWFTLRIVHRGNNIEGYLNGQKVTEARDATFTDAGAVGLWTKADAQTSFDDLVVKEL